jgi:bacterioferritin B
MIIHQSVLSALNRQVGNEFGASLQYVAIASYFAVESLPELAKFFFKQSEEEREHAMRLVRFIIDAGGEVTLPAIPAPKSNFQSAEDAVQHALNWELEVTEQINKLVELSTRESDYISHNFLQWFVAEQLEEVSTMDSLLKIVQRASDRLLFVEEYLAREKGQTKGEPVEQAD